jgi:hypothetical protein
MVGKFDKPVHLKLLITLKAPSTRRFFYACADFQSTKHAEALRQLRRFQDFCSLAFNALKLLIACKASQQGPAMRFFCVPGFNFQVVV